MITGGTIAYEDGRKADTEYTPARKARVELRFDLAEGLDEAGIHAAISAVQAECVARVQALLAGVIPPQTSVSLMPALDATAPKKPVGRPKKAEPNFPPTTKDEIAEAIFGARDPMAGIQTQPPLRVASAIPLQEPFDVVAPQVSSQRNEPSPVSDRELHSAVQFKLQKTNNPVPIRELIAKMCEAGKPPKLDAVPQDRRREFFAELEKL